MLKQPKFKSEVHRRWIATLSCALCGILGSSQAAHVHKRKHSITGGKVWDKCVPLCHEGANGCHDKLDSYKAEDKRDGLINLGIGLHQVTGDTERAERILQEWRS